VTSVERVGVGAIGVIGHGAVGRRVVRNLLFADQVDEVLLVSSGPAHDRARMVDERALREAADVVVLATPAPQHLLAQVLLSSGRSVVTTSDDYHDGEALLGLERLALDAGRPLVVGATASPGLTGLLARFAAGRLDTVDEIHVVAHGTGGPACARQHHLALGSSSRFWYEGEWRDRPGGTGRELCWFPDPLGAHDCYRAALVDPLFLHRVFPEATRVTARLTATRRDRLTARLPMLRSPHPEALVGAVRVEVRGADRVGRRQDIVLGAAQPLGVMAGAVAAALALASARGELPPGLALPGDVTLPTERLLEAVRGAGIPIHHFVGTASRTSW